MAPGRAAEVKPETTLGFIKERGTYPGVSEESALGFKQGQVKVRGAILRAH